jgi:tetratricopeptide (TPR) repeat protein
MGCGASSKGIGEKINRSAPTADKVSQYQTLLKEAEAAWLKRGERAQLELAIQKWEQAIKLKDDDYETYGKLARALYLLADGWIQFENNVPAYLAGHERGFDLALRGLAAASPEFEKRVRAGTNIENAIKVVGRNAVPLIYWYASHLGKWAKKKGFTTVLKYKDRIFAMVSRVYELDRRFFYGAADRYFGAFYAVAPSFAGGDLHKSHQHFTASIKIAPNYLGTYVLAAELYAPKNQDPDTFDKYLKLVIDAKPCGTEGATSPCILKELVPESVIEKKKAKQLLAEKDEKF